ncbi:hypothetical protein TNCT_652161 [Trichonephila clavata]|uniref:Uncharacterized protein n=1 Tax=Trichonephila clavata TaxID=2740835 RepID=A0A8X6I186_TRICU|nr:hypothetical protein TNCT_652161 [Trichonephila clavata]
MLMFMLRLIHRLSCLDYHHLPETRSRLLPSEILDVIPCKQWRYVPSKDNPADFIFRSTSPKYLPDCSVLWEGPQSLTTEEAIKFKGQKRHQQTCYNRN